MLARLLGEDIDVRTSLAPGAELVRADPSQLEQVLLNLVVNARDAMPDGGKLTIETASVVLDDHYVRTHPDAHPGPHVLLAVSDTGCGIAEDVRRHLFEPFFTTKQMGQGTGLGLSTVHGIVTQSGGSIEIYSELGRGTVFKIYLPAAGAEAGSTEQSESVPVLTGSETILVAEDEREVREFTASALERFGYHVLKSTSPSHALELCQSEPGPIHLLLTDVVMPRMSGRELARQVRSMRPLTRVLYMSGYTDNVIVHHGILDEGTPFIQKPFSPEMLCAKVRGVLGVASAATT